MENKSIEQLMNLFIDNTPEPNIDREYHAVEEQYEKLFGHSVPTEMLPPNISKDDIKAAMKKCIEAKKDQLFDLLGVQTNNDYLY